MGDSKITSSLLPMKIRREKMWRDKTKWFGAAAAIFVLGTGMSLLGYYVRDLEYKAAADIRENRIDPILSKATELSDAWRDKVEGNGAADRLTIQNVRSMLEGRTLWVNLLGDIFAALPPVPPGYPSPQYLKTHPRPTRNIILIDKIDSVYYPDLLQALTTAPPELGLPPSTPGQPVSDPAIPAGSRGFIITISLTTPHKDGFLFALSSFIPNLKKYDRAAMDAWNAANPKNPKIFTLPRCRRRCSKCRSSADPTRTQQLQASYTDAQALLGVKPGEQSAGSPPPGPYGGYRGPQYGGPTGRFGPPGGYFQRPSFNSQPAAANGAGADNGMYIDRLTQEDRRDDWEMKVELVVVIDPSPQAAGARQRPNRLEKRRAIWKCSRKICSASSLGSLQSWPWWHCIGP